MRLTPLNLWLLRSRHCRFAAYRVDAMKEADMPRLRAALDAMMGKPYDYHYAPDDSEIYCSELVCRAYERGLGMKIGEWQKLGELRWQAFEKFIRSMEQGELPLDREMITPVALTHSRLVHKVSFW